MCPYSLFSYRFACPRKSHSCLSRQPRRIIYRSTRVKHPSIHRVKTHEYSVESTKKPAGTWLGVSNQNGFVSSPGLKLTVRTVTPLFGQRSRRSTREWNLAAMHRPIAEGLEKAPNRVRRRKNRFTKAAHLSSLTRRRDTPIQPADERRRWWRLQEGLNINRCFANLNDPDDPRVQLAPSDC